MNNRKTKQQKKSKAVSRVIAKMADLRLARPKRPIMRKLANRKPRQLEGGYAQQIKVSAPAAFGSRTKVAKASFGGGRTIIKHSEYVGDIGGSVGFTIALSLNLNPGLQGSFPWLSQIANAYEKFSVKQIQYRYCSESPTSTTGAVFLSPEYNPQDAPPSSKLETFQNEDTVRTVPWEDVTCKIPTKYLKVYNEYFIRLGNMANSDLKTYDPLVLNVCTQGNANGGTIGEIWVDYQIELINPQGNINPVGGSATCMPSSSVLIFGNNSTGTGPVNFGNLKITLNGLVNNIVLSPCVVGAEYEVVVVVQGAGLLGLTVGGIAGGTTLNQYPALTNTANTVSCNVYTFTANATVVTLGYSTLTGTSFINTYVSCLPIPIGGI
jgi:hypothetical protein